MKKLYRNKKLLRIKNKLFNEFNKNNINTKWDVVLYHMRIEIYNLHQK